MRMIFLLGIFFGSLSSRAWVNKTVFLKGRILAFDHQKAEFEAENGQRFFIPKTAIPKNYKIVTGSSEHPWIPVDRDQILDIKSKDQGQNHNEGPSKRPLLESPLERQKQLLRRLKKII